MKSYQNLAHIYCTEGQKFIHTHTNTPTPTLRIGLMGYYHGTTIFLLLSLFFRMFVGYTETKTNLWGTIVPIQKVPHKSILPGASPPPPPPHPSTLTYNRGENIPSAPTYVSSGGNKITNPEITVRNNEQFKDSVLSVLYTSDCMVYMYPLINRSPLAN